MSSSNLSAPSRQLTLDDASPDAPDHSAATAALDAIRDRFGADAIGPASVLDAGRMRIAERGGQQRDPDERLER